MRTISHCTICDAVTDERAAAADGRLPALFPVRKCRTIRSSAFGFLRT
jgi:hypothetical protein